MSEELIPYQALDEDSSGKHFDKKKEEEIQHDLKCENCGDPAEVNHQLVWVSWDITPDEDYKNMEFYGTDENEFWCSRCWNLDRAEKYDELKKIRDEHNQKIKEILKEIEEKKCQ